MALWLPLLLPLSLASTSDPVDAARAHWEARGHQVVADLAEFLAIPCVAGDVDGIRRSGDWIIAEFAERGVEIERIDIEGASPLLVGRLDAGRAERTYGVYVHYDGQPVDASRWSTPGPWTPTLYDGDLEHGGKPIGMPGPEDAIGDEWRLYARAAGDDKGPLVAWLAALDALETAEIARTVNLVFLFDGEEEAGSPHLGAYLEGLRERLADVDVWLFCDGPVHASRRPQLCFGVRGVTGLELTVYGASRPLHSGHYGNWAPNAAERMAELLASMSEPDGRAAIEGFYDSTTPPDDFERAAVAALPDFDDLVCEDLSMPPPELSHGDGAPGYFESLLLPSLNVLGVSSGNVGELARNVIPNRATANLGLRLVAGNDPEAMLDLVERHIAQQGYHIVREEPDSGTLRAHARVVRVTRRGGYPAARTPMSLPLAREVAEVARSAAGDELLLVPTLGGSLPLYLFTDPAQGLGQPIVVVPIANHDDHQHAPDENLRMANLAYGVELFAALAAASVR